MKLIINADDMGLSIGINKGIQKAFRYGHVRSATVMVNHDAFSHAVDIIKANPFLGVGLHLNLTNGAPLTDYPYVDGSKRMSKDTDWKKASPQAIEKELTAQIKKAITAGIHITHLDSHHHIHDLPELKPIFQRLAAKYRFLVRPIGSWEREDIYLSTSFFGDVSDDMLLEEIKKGLKSGKPYMELMCHPGISDAYLRTISSYSDAREKELNILCDARLINFINWNGIELCSYKGFVPST